MLFPDLLIEWYSQNKRLLPWRSDNKVYNIWLSEIIFQQTRINQGLAYYLRFTEAFPDVFTLASASIDDVLKLWQGLGYYTRARNLHKTANIIVHQFDGVFPKSMDDLKNLPGIGHYTAAAIASICYNVSEPVLDGNAIRVYCRFLGIEEDPRKSAVLNQLRERVRPWMQNVDAGTFNQAVMEFGALQCTPSNPDCFNCPLNNQCIAFKNGMLSSIPLKPPKSKKKERFFHYFFLTDTEQSFTYLSKRKHNDIWKGLFEFPMTETVESIEFSELPEHIEPKKSINSVSQMLFTKAFPKHMLSHQNLYIRFYHIVISDDFCPDKEWIIVPIGQIHRYAVPKPIEQFLSGYINR